MTTVARTAPTVLAQHKAEPSVVVIEWRGAAARELYLKPQSVMRKPSFTGRYTAAMAACGGRCPIEAGLIGRLADHECRHGRLAFDPTPACGCWAEEGAAVIALTRPALSPAGHRRAA